jgi:hypothetical protein
MSERTAEQIRAEIAYERRRLDDDLDALRAEIRSFVPYLIAGVAAVANPRVRKGTADRIVTDLEASLTVPDSTADEIRRELTAERQRLRQDVDGLKAEFRRLLLYLAGGLVAAALLAAGVFTAIRKLLKRH